MKHSVLILLAAALLVAGCGKARPFTVNGTLEDAKISIQADSVRVECEAIEQTVKAAVSEGAFTLKGKVSAPSIAKFAAFGDYNQATRLIILEKGTISFRDGRAVGTPLNDSTDAFVQRYANLLKAYQDPEQRLAAVKKEMSSFVARHKDDPCAAFAIMMSDQRLDPSFTLELINTVSPGIQNVGSIHAMKGRLERESRKQ